MLAVLGFLMASGVVRASDEAPLLSSSEPAPMRLTVISANVHVAAGVEPVPDQGLPAAVVRENLGKLAELFASAQADVILLQEVDFGCRRTGRIDEGEFLAKRLAMHHYFAVTLDTTTDAAGNALPAVLRECRYGLAALTRAPALSTSITWLPNPPESNAWSATEGRALLTLTLPLGENDRIAIGNTHLDYRRRDTRREQAAVIARVLPPMGWILAGDFNEPFFSLRPAPDVSETLVRLHGWDYPDTGLPLWEILSPRLAERTVAAPATYPVSLPEVTIDLVLAAGRARLVRVDRLDSAGLSDHHFVRAVVEIGPAAEEKRFSEND